MNLYVERSSFPGCQESRNMHQSPRQTMNCRITQSNFLNFCFVREWLPTPVFLPGEFHSQRSLAGYNPWGGFQRVGTERLALSFQIGRFIGTGALLPSQPISCRRHFVREETPLRKPRCQCADFLLQLHPESAQHSEGAAGILVFVGR